jgi:hypothetical protein
MPSPRLHPGNAAPAIFALVAACAVVSPAPAPAPAPLEAPPATQAAPSATSQAPAPAAADVPQSPEKSASKAVVPPKNAPDGKPAAAPKKSAPAIAKAAPPAASPAPAAVAPAVVAAPVAAPPPLDLKSLEQKLKETKAIGLMTKLSIKNQVDDLVSQFRVYHEGRRPPTLPELRRPYEMLLMKILSLLQDQDPGLARDLHQSQEAIWGVLSDRNKFSQNL